MAELEIERSLRQASEELSQPFSQRYDILKDRLLKIDYPYWSKGFPGGNDHGPAHIMRVMEKLDLILGNNPLQRQLVTHYELFLVMMSVLYHDIGILRQRKGHAKFSELIVEEEKNTYVINEQDKEIIRAAVVSHTIEKDIEAECEKFSEVERIGGDTVRPRVVAALVRLADKLDEDYRRADPVLEQRLDIPEKSKFFWQFCRRILAIHPEQHSKEIVVNVKFKVEDIARPIQIDGTIKSFISAFADKLAIINRERVKSNKFLPEEIRYHRLKVVVKPLENHAKWKRPREFVFTDYTLAYEIVEKFPELLKDPAAESLLESLQLIRTGKLDDADVKLKRLEEISSDLPAYLRLPIFYNRACVESLRSEELPAESSERRTSLRRALQHLTKWLMQGDKSAWKEAAKDRWNEIYRLASDRDLWCLMSERRSSVVHKIPRDLRSALPGILPRPTSGGGGGCVPAGTSIETPNGRVSVENIREGDEIMSLCPGILSGAFITRVSRVHTSREPMCICLNRRYFFTPSQPLFGGQREWSGWIKAGDLAPGMWVFDLESKRWDITHVDDIEKYFEVYNLTTDHPSQNYIAYGLLCHNKYMLM